MSESKLIHNSHNVSYIVFHSVCTKKYRLVVIDVKVDKHLRKNSTGIELRYDYKRLLEIGADKSHVHFLIKFTLNYSTAKIVSIVKSITAKRILLNAMKLSSSYGRLLLDHDYYVSM